MKRILKKLQDEYGIKIAQGTKTNRHYQGIHLLRPSQDELTEALIRADQQGFKYVFLHNNLTFESNQ